MTQHVQWSLQTCLDEERSRAELRFQSRQLLSRLLGQFQHEHHARYLIDSRCRNGRSRRPIAFAPNLSGDIRQGPLIPVRRRLSISHVDRCVAAAVSNHRMGIDVIDDDVESKRGLLQIWFDEREREIIGDGPLPVFWAAKEASYKAHCRCDSFRPSQWKIVAVNRSSYDPCILNCRVTQTDHHFRFRTAYVSIVRRAEFRVAIATVTANPVLDEQTFPSNTLQFI